MARTLKDFKAAHDALAVSSAVHDRFLNSAPKGTTHFIFTAAQNATPVSDKFWRSLLAAKAHYKAHLSVILLRYKNPTSIWSRSQENAEVWAPEIEKFRLNQRFQVNKNLCVSGSIKVVPTASDPLTGFEALTGAESMIIGHTKLAFRTVPVPGAQMAKLLTTTGACTVPNYSDSRAGAGGQFHHTIGAVIVEVMGGKFFLRHLIADDSGEFIDLDVKFTPKGVEKAPPPVAIALGDTHVEFTDPGVDKATFGTRGIVMELKPKRIYWHDLCDNYAVNPHHFGNPFNEIAKAKTGKDDAEAEVARAIEFVKSRTPEWSESFIVASNHNDFLSRYIVKADWKMIPPKNRAFYLRTALAMVEGTRLSERGTEYPDPFAHWVNQANIPRVRCLQIGESSRVLDIEMGMHGDEGPNGARGSRKNLRRLGVRALVGHGHGPGIDEWCYQVGTSSRLRLEYNLGPSNWLHTHGCVHSNGKIQLITMIDGKYRL